MSDQAWDKPSPALKRIATYKPPPMLRECRGCSHRHEPGRRCGYPTGDRFACTCES